MLELNQLIIDMNKSGTLIVMHRFQAGMIFFTMPCKHGWCWYHHWNLKKHQRGWKIWQKFYIQETINYTKYRTSKMNDFRYLMHLKGIFVKLLVIYNGMNWCTVQYVRTTKPYIIAKYVHNLLSLLHINHLPGTQ